MNETYHDALADYGGSLISHVGLVNAEGVELAGGSYARKVVSWTQASGGRIRPSANLVFNIPAGATVAAWRGYSALEGGIDYHGADLTQETFAGEGEYILQKNLTSILHG